MIGFFTYLHLGKTAMGIIARIDYEKLNTSILVLILLLVYWMTGTFGLLLSILATAVGVIPILAGISRTHLMGVLIVPTLTYTLLR